MTSNPVDEQHTRGWRELKPMQKGAKRGHAGCEIDEHRMIILGGEDYYDVLSSGFIYDARTKQSTPLPNDIPEARCCFCAVANKLYMNIIGGRGADGRAVNARTEQSTPLPNNVPAALHDVVAVANEQYMYVIGGKGADGRTVNTLYRLSLETYQWTTMAPMGTARYRCAVVLLGDYFYIFGGYNDDVGSLASVERYSIVGNTWEDLPRMAVARCGHCAVAAMRNRIYILGGGRTRALEVFDTALLDWRTEATLCYMPEVRKVATAVVLKDRYLVVIRCFLRFGLPVNAACLIYDCSINQWSSTPASMNIITARQGHTAAVLDGKIVVAGGYNGGQCLSSMECIDARDVLEYAPLDYPLPVEYFNQILQLGKALLITKHA